MNCPLPLQKYPHIILGHGGGGQLTSDLLEHLILPAFNNPYLARLGDSTVLDLPGSRLAFSTDSYVVRPLFFPGGNIGELAINGTINDLAMSGASPLYLSAGLIIEEGLSLESLKTIVNAMAQAAARAGVQIVAGDTKVVERGHGDGCYINTSGIGVVPAGLDLAVSRAQPGDQVLLSGTIGDHGMAIMSVREGLEFEAPIVSDTCPLHELVRQLLSECPNVRALRDPTRGGLATSLIEIATAAKVGIVVDEPVIPVKPAVRSACEILGLDPWFVANEGKFLAIVPPDQSERACECLRQSDQGEDATLIGYVTSEHPGRVVAKTALGASRIITLPIGEQLPRIC